MPDRPVTPEQTIQRLRAEGVRSQAAHLNWGALLAVAEAANELRLFEPGRQGDAQARSNLFAALARLAGERPGD